MIDKETKEAVPVTAFLRPISSPGRRAGQRRRARQVAVDRRAWRWRCSRNYDPFKAPTHFKIVDLLKKFDKTFGATGKDYGKVDRRPDASRTSRSAAPDRWNFLFIAGMWFQDLFNYDFRRTEMCIIPYATQQGEISFCAYNTGIGWRNIIEKMHMTATLTKWYEEHGRHEIFAGNKAVPLATHGALAEAERRGRGHRRADRPRRARHREERARREAAGAQEGADDPKHHDGDGQALPPARAEGAAPTSRSSRSRG